MSRRRERLSDRAGLSESTQSGLCRTDRPYNPRLEPAREALPPDLPGQYELPGKEAESLSGGSRGQSHLAARAPASGELRSAATQPGFSSLDEIQNNRNIGDLVSFERLGRNGFCGIWTTFGESADGLGTKFHRLNCKTWACCYCGPKKAKRYRFLIGQLAEREQLTRFLTLTLDPSLIEGDSVKYLRSVFNKFRLYLRRKYGVPVKYIAILEFHKSGVAHLHLLVDRFIPWEWIKNSWSALGGGQVVFITYVDVHRISRYLSKYLTKDLLLSAPKRSRRVTTSRSLHLIEKKASNTSWTLLRATIFLLFSRLRDAAIEIRVDEEGFLTSFSCAPQTV
jgi:hypothetical protein